MAKSKRRASAAKEENRRRPNVFAILVLAAFALALVFVVLTFWETGGSRSELDRLTAFKKNGVLTFIGSGGDKLRTIDVEIADSESRRQVGLMYRKPLEDSQGMLFIFPVQGALSFWMHNTPISIDMVFADSTGEIVTIHRNARPFDQTQYRATSPAMYVVEVAAGFTDRYRVLVGDSIRWERTESAEN